MMSTRADETELSDGPEISGEVLQRMLVEFCWREPTSWIDSEAWQGFELELLAVALRPGVD
ncbi:hypothetical protein D9M68_569590 [compost metagenome]